MNSVNNEWIFIPDNESLLSQDHIKILGCFYLLVHGWGLAKLGGGGGDLHYFGKLVRGLSDYGQLYGMGVV